MKIWKIKLILLSLCGASFGVVHATLESEGMRQILDSFCLARDVYRQQITAGACTPHIAEAASREFDALIAETSELQLALTGFVCENELLQHVENATRKICKMILFFDALKFAKKQGFTLVEYVPHQSIKYAGPDLTTNTQETDES